MANAVEKAHALENAFEAFNRHSSMLETSYQALQEKVSLLSAQLEASQRVESQQHLEKELLGNRLIRLLEILPGVVLVIDGEGTIRECNTRSEEILGTPLIGCAWSVIVQRAFCRGASRDGELKLRNGRWLSLSRTPLGTEPGEILLLTDITESRRTAELVQRSDRLTSLGEMTARLGHQIRTPLASALLYASKLNATGTPEQKVAARNVSQRLRDLGNMVDDMLSFAAGPKLPGEVIQVAELFHDVADAIAPQLDAGSQIKIEVVNPDLRVLANREALKGALLNLITNAAQAADASPVIELCAVHSGDQVCLTVTDNGPGIRKDIRSRLFDPFFTTRPQGTGLGLAVVRSVAQAHGGDVMLDCGPHGTAFSICLPELQHNDAARTDALEVSGYE
ncbi:MAG: sensor histidine kinase [Woeseiaceae bacterium]